MKKVLLILVCFVASVLLVYLPRLNDRNDLKAEIINNESLVAQDVLAYSEKPLLQHKLYHNQDLIGVVQDVDALNAFLNNYYMENYVDEFPDNKISLGQDVYLIDEYAYYKTADADEAIFNYLIDNKLVGLEVTAIEFSTRDGVYDIIYIDDLDKFYEARDRFLLNFISAEALTAFRNGETVETTEEYGSVEVGMRIAETIVSKKAVALPEEIMTDVNEIYEFLCYGRNDTRIYHTVAEGETLQGVGYNYNNLSPLQLMMLNPDKIYNVDQVLKPGMVLNVTYFDSPITVYVTKERLARETVVPESPLYVEDPEMYVDETAIISPEANGEKNVLYEEIWVNGVLQSGEIRSQQIVIEPVQGVIAVGTMAIPNVGTGNFLWPVDNPRKTCLWQCYVGHQALDVESMYNRWGNVYASDNGTVVDVSYDDVGGNHITIDHNNGYMTYYGHLSSPAYPEVGDTVRRGQVIGSIGATGVATGPHVHWGMYVDGTLVDPCSIVNCNAIP